MEPVFAGLFGLAGLLGSISLSVSLASWSLVESIFVRFISLAGGGQLPFARKLAQEPPAALRNQWGGLL